MQSEARCFPEHYVLYIYELLLIFILHRTIFFMLITIKNSCSYHIVDSSVVYLIIAIEARCITISSVHGYFEVINT